MIGGPGVVVDPYDDRFDSLKEMFNNKQIPDFIKEAEIMSNEDLSFLPDHAFAVVVLGGDQPMRKYACSDKAHTAVNVMYFLRNEEQLPNSVKTKAASNLVRACEYFGLGAPKELVKAAQGGKVLIKGDGAEMTVPGGDDKNKKLSELVGTRTMPVSKPGDRTKVAHVMESPYVELHEWEYEAKTKTASFDPRTSVMDSSLSLLPYDNVIKARDYFDEQSIYMHPRERHEYCVKLAARADQLGIPVSDTVRKYGSTNYGSRGSLKVAFEQRSQLWSSLDNQVGDSVASQLLEKRASIPPDMFVEMLAELDAQTGIDQYWDDGIPDPWLSVYDFEKKAEWEWQQSGEHLTEGALKKLSSERSGEIKEKFGSDMATAMTQDPTTIFDSLPLEQKRVIARMAQQ